MTNLCCSDEAIRIDLLELKKLIENSFSKLTESITYKQETRQA